MTPESVSFPRLPLARFNKMVNLTLKRMFEEHGCQITREQEIILRELSRSDGINQLELAQRVGQDRNNLSRTLGILEGRGLIEREVRLSDKRHYNVHITQSGRELHVRAYAVIEAYWQILFQGFDQSEIDFFARAVHRLTDNLARYVDNGDNGNGGDNKR